MDKLTRSLNRWEMCCPCGCDVDTVDYELPPAIQGCVDYFQLKYKTYDVGVHINSGNRCKEYNKTIKGASSTSKHTEYRAADFYLYDKNSGDYKTGVQIHADEIADYLEETYPNKFGIGRYTGRTHLDTRAIKSRWDRR